MAVGGSPTYIAGGLYGHIEREAIVAFSDANVALPLTRQASVGAAQTISWDVVNNGTNTATSADLSSVTDGTEITTTLLNSDKKTATPIRYAIRLDLYGDSRLSNVTDPGGRMGPLVGNAAAAKIDNLIAAEMDNFTTSVGTSTIAMTVDNIFSALQTIKSGGAIGVPSMLLEVKQVYGANGVLNDLVTSNQFGGSPEAQARALETGILGPIAGVPTYITREFTEASSATKGGMFVPDAVGTGWAGPLIEVEMDNEPKYDRQSWFAKLYFDAQIIAANWGAEIWTKTS